MGFGMRRKNKIGGLMSSDRVWHEEESGIERIMVEYYEGLFTFNSPSMRTFSRFSSMLTR